MERLLLDNIYGFLRTAVVCIDAQERIQYLNAFAVSELESAEEQIIGKRFSELFVKEEAEFSGAQLWRWIPTGKCFEFDRVVNQNDRKPPVLSRLALPECRGWGVMRFSAAADAVQALEHSFDDFGLILLEEKRVLRIFGRRSWQELCGCEVSGLESFREPGKFSLDWPVVQTLRDQKIHRTRQKIDGRDYVVSSYPVIRPEQPLGILLVYLDLTKLNKVQNRLVQATRDAEDANRAKSFFLANMSHELRTPLNAVIGYCELLQEGGLSPEQTAESLAGINLGGNALLRLINNILDLSKIEARQMVFAPKPTDLVSMTMELKALFTQSCQKNHISQELDIQPELPLLMVDELRLRQIMLNLIGNACKFTHDGFLRITVRYTPAAGGNGTLSIAVADSGCGIAKDKQEAIFKPFTQEDAMTHPHIFKGTGLGLAIARQMALCMRGRIELQSELGKGSVFTVILDDVPAVRQVPVVAPAAIPEQLPEAYLKGLDVLLVDDVPINLKILSAMCNSFGVKNRTAGSAEEALKMIRESMPNLVMTDMWMPVMSGVELLAEIRKDKALDELPVVIVTADVEAGEKGVLEKFDAEVLKPVSKEKLRNLFIELYSLKAKN